MQTVYVVAWSFDTGGGFDWYYTAASADRAFEEEKQNADSPELAREGWTAYRFTVEVTGNSPEEITDEIDAELLGLCDAAPVRYKHAA